MGIKKGRMKKADMGNTSKAKFITPKIGQRFKFVDGYEDSIEIKRMIESKKAFGHDTFIFIKTAKPEKDIEGYNVYIALFAQVLTNPIIELVDIKTDKLTSVNINPFWLAYKKAYKEGRDYFNKNFGLSSEVLYGKYGGVLERTIHTHYYHTDFRNFNEGWSYWERYTPLIFEIGTFSKYGYYGGIISALNEYKKLHPKMFSNFNVCRDSTIHSQTEVKLASIALEDLKRSKLPNAFNNTIPLSLPIEHFRVLVEKPGKKGDGYLTEADFVLFIKAAFLGQKMQTKINLKLMSGSKGQIISLFYRFYLIGVQYERSSHVREKYVRLLTDNFAGWNFQQVNNNFRD